MQNLSNFLSDKGFKGTVVNQVLPSVQEGSLPIRLTCAYMCLHVLCAYICVFSKEKICKKNNFL